MAFFYHVLFAGELPSQAALSQRFGELDFPLAFGDEAGLSAQHAGHLPMRLRGEECGLALDIWNSRQDVEDIAGEEVDQRLTRAATVRWEGGDEAGAAASCFTAALATLVEGIVLESHGNADLTPDQMIAIARANLKSTAERYKRPGTGPDDIRRYLAPLLEQRSDLTLVGRRLLIRPVRHLLRGALFEPTGDRFALRVRPYLMPLYDGRPEGAGLLGHIRNEYEVWRRNFVPYLIDDLAERIFGPLARIATIADLAGLRVRGGPQPGQLLMLDEIVAQRRNEAHLAGDASDRARITALVLAGEIDRAAALVKQYEEQAQQGETPVRLHFDNLVRDLDATCTEHHAREASLVGALQLGHIWERSPFPVEVGAVASGRLTAEPAFSVTPWPALLPGMRQEGPTQPGQVSFAESCYWQGETPMLRAALTPEQAEDRHRALEDYTLVVNLPDGRLLTVKHSTGFDRNDPAGAPRGQLDPIFYIGLRRGPERIFAQVSSTYLRREHPGLTQVFSIERYRASERKWLGYFLLHEGTRSIHDWRSGEQRFASAPLTEAERDLCVFRRPAFGEYQVFVDRIEALLRLDDTVESLESREEERSDPTPTQVDVAFHGNLPGKEALAAVFGQLGFPLAFHEDSPRLAQHDGSLRMRLRGREVAVEFDTWDVSEVFAALVGAESVPHHANSASFGWSDDEERAVALCLGAALAQLRDGLVAGLQSDGNLTAEEAVACAREALANLEQGAV